MSYQRPAPLPLEPPELAPATVSPALNKGTGTRSIGDRLRFWWALAWPLVALGGLWYGAYKAVDALTWPVVDVTWWCGVVTVPLVIRVVWVGLTFRQDVQQYRYSLALWDAQLRNYEKTGQEQRAALRAYTAAAYRLPGPNPQEVELTHRTQQQVEAARMAREEAEKAKAAAEGVLALLGQAEPARVAPFSVEPTTMALDDPGRLPDPPRVDYVGTDLAALMAVAFSGKAPSGAYFRAQGWGRERYEAARDTLIRAGVLHLPGLGRAVALAPDFAAACKGLPVDGKHDKVETWLARDVPAE